jgi:hypothetical protein
MHPTHPRRRPWPAVLLLVLTAVALALLAVVLVAPPVGAGALGGVEPGTDRTRVPLAPGLSPLPWLAGAASLAMAAAAAGRARRRRPGTFDDPDLPGGA